MRVSDFTYELPEERIAKYPPTERGQSRLLVLHKTTGQIEHRDYKDFVEYINAGDVVVLNDTKVFKARLIGITSNGQQRELLLLEDHHTTDTRHRKALYRGKITPGEQLKVGESVITIENTLQGGIAEISSPISLLELAEHSGTVPLPPYIHREATEEDTKRYQTVFALQPGSVAAPTASLNFTESLQKDLEAKGVTIAYLTLHVGLGTFLPIRSDNIEDHKMHSEYFEIPHETIQAIQKAKTNGKKVIAIGTTVARTLEYAHVNISRDSRIYLHGEADIFIYPGYEFKIVDALLTNFHAPKTTVLMLAAAFAAEIPEFAEVDQRGWNSLKNAYEQAIQENYAFLSYGDSMLII